MTRSVPEAPVLRRISLALVLASLAASCAHAPPVGGNKDPNAPPDPDRPEVNCQVNNTVDCRPASSF